jgi:alkylated DNA repair dioxygenase AlkB
VRDLAHILVTQYAPGTPIGWHRDAPQFERIAGVSLAGACRMRFKPFEGTPADILNLALEPRSAYALTGPARWRWQHSIAPTPGLRYSITLRTLATPAAT